jgi:ABC-2 type transport system permease protein
MLAGLVVTVLGVALAWAGLIGLRDASDAAAHVVTVTGGSAIALGFLLAPPLVGDDQLDPRRFRPLGVTAGPLALAILAASVIGLPLLALVVVAAGVVVLWLQQGAGAAASLGGPVLGVLIALLLTKLSGAATARMLRERRSRELTGLFVLLLLIVVVPAGVFVASLGWGRTAPSALVTATRVLSLTPFGAPWALPGYAAADDPLVWGSLAVAVATIAVLSVAWFAVVDRVLHAPERPVTARARAGMSWFAVMPATAGGAIAARSLLYWLHDRRYGVNVIIVPVAALLTTVPLVIAGVPAELVVLVPLPIVALFFGWMPHNDLAYDSTALWLHIASGVRGIADRLGRLVPIVLIAVPTFAVFLPVTVLLNGRWVHLLPLTGVCASLFLAGLGLSSISSAAAPYAVSRPGDSPFRQPQRTEGAGIAAQALVLLGTVIVSIPTLRWAWLAVTRDAALGPTALVAGFATGVVVLGLGLAIGSVVFERRGSALMEFAETAA